MATTWKIRCSNFKFISFLVKKRKSGKNAFSVLQNRICILWFDDINLRIYYSHQKKIWGKRYVFAVLSSPALKTSDNQQARLLSSPKHRSSCSHFSFPLPSPKVGPTAPRAEFAVFPWVVPSVPLIGPPGATHAGAQIPHHSFLGLWLLYSLFFFKSSHLLPDAFPSKTTF